MYFSEVQLNQNILIKVSTEQRKIINEAFDFYIEMFDGNFGVLNCLMVRHYATKIISHHFGFCQRLCKILEKVYFKDIKWKDINGCQHLNKVHNLREDIKFSKKDFECRVKDALLISNIVLEYYQRILMGQLNHIDEQMRLYLYWDQIKKNYDSDLIRQIINDMCYYYFNKPINASYGICSPELCISAKKAYQMLRWIENDIYGHFKVKGAGNDYSNQSPLKVTKQKRIKIEFPNEL